MGNTWKRLSVTSFAAVAIFAMTTVTNASAASGVAACSTNGASGSMTFTNWSNNHVDISGWVKDNAADGHHVAIRLVSTDGSSAVEYKWPWRHEYDGNGSTLSFTTYANNSDGMLRFVGVRVAVMEGDQIVDSRVCTDWA